MDPFDNRPRYLRGTQLHKYSTRASILILAVSSVIAVPIHYFMCYLGIPENRKFKTKFLQRAFEDRTLSPFELFQRGQLNSEDSNER